MNQILENTRIVQNTTNNIIKKLHERQGNDKAALAALRHSSSILSKQASVVWPLIFAYGSKEKHDHNKNQTNDVPKILSKNGTPTSEENAIFTALRCYAVFEQGNDDERDRAVSYTHLTLPTT